MADTPYNITPSLGANFRDPETVYHWDLIAPSSSGASPQLGTMLRGNDGRDFVHAKATPAFAASARADLNETTWALTANAAGAWVLPANVATAAGENVWVRRFVI
ncbi:MAG: hypothetical protein U5N55_12690 [Cypionkella sp.]|nr:hypothetical protein [Cypionkella sp.]